MRQADVHAVHEFLDRTLSGPAGMVIEGEAGIGKTTYLLRVAEAATAQGFRVLSTAGALTEARYAYAAVADLLETVDPAVIANLPAVQRTALERVLLLTGDGPPTNERTVAAAFLSVLQHRGSGAPILVTIDDAQWLDVSSQVVFGYAARRLTGRIGVAVSVRIGEPRRNETPGWLRFARPDSVARIRLQPLPLGGVHALISQRLGRTLPRPVITRIHEISGGNPFFALEMARAVADEPSRGVVGLPDSLAALVRQRIGRPDDELSAVLLAASCAVFPTVERLSRAIELSVDRVVEVVESVGASGVVELDGNKVRFCHPLFARGVYSGASPPQRRAMHRRFADTVEEPELRARHLALSATTGDPAMLEALDKAAEVTMAQGAPAAAAELLDLAIKLGGDTSLRRIRAAEHHFRSGALDQAGVRLQSTIDRLTPGSSLRCVGLMLVAAITGHDDSMLNAVAALTQAVAEVDDPVLALQGRLLLAPATGLIGEMQESVEHAQAAVVEAERLGLDGLVSQALTMWVTVTFIHGLGFDRSALQRALELEDPNGWAGATFQATAVAAVAAGWAGELVDAREQMRKVQRRYLQEGTEIDILWADHHATMMDIWLGRYGDATAGAEDAVQRAEQLGGKHMLTTSWTCQAAAAAYTGREDETRQAARSAIDAAQSMGTFHLLAPAMTALGFLEVSLSNYAAALAVLEPVLASFDPAHDTEIMVGAYLPDAIEALTALGRHDEAEPLVEALESAGVQHDRPWLLAVGARGRGHVLAARGDLESAESAAQNALSHHQRLPMPFELARTQLLLGQIQRRRRRRQAAETTLQECLEMFERLGAPLWAQRARGELERLNIPVADGHGLTAAERRVAELAASGMSNKQIAAELFIAPKTVEMNLSNVYRKLGIRSRGGLAGALNPGNSQGKP
ncbi:LuxR C-terminal-related transcriptional regulator [Candidatus Mycobacterium wuenschmannii]|uniref:LuxR C-terminal-related transcriptional regulator n=1 Tax=Candidatus Mycobacterium wuenschmannii TaxID=3027808 RepID=A0ABY8VRA7_9MYCO|nr:LuxR family transcriptional regulator [Candidatus Mycobacterium wuenschmannii]WIM85861.1 LuxR C-terminal-related transcriptional regulator [Candidatus Mycobacterium wuenschmannii]